MQHAILLVKKYNQIQAMLYLSAESTSKTTKTISYIKPLHFDVISVAKHASEESYRLRFAISYSIQFKNSTLAKTEII